MKISKSMAALVGMALLMVLVLIIMASRTQDPVLSTGSATASPADVSAIGGSSARPTTPAPTKDRASAAPSSKSTTPPLRKLKATPVETRVIGVRAQSENVGFSGSGDIADDAAIWVDPVDPRRSVVIAGNKDEGRGGIGVFGMDGKLVQFTKEGEIGNVDIRTGFPGKNGAVVLVGANNRSTNALELWVLNTRSRRLSSVANGRIKTMAANYGFCLYHSKRSDTFYAFVTPEDKGFIQQFELLPQDSGMVDAKLVRELPISGKTEGCVADDDNGKLYVGQEEVAIWKYGTEPRDPSDRVAVDRAGRGHLDADIEGMAIAYGADGSGYLFVSSQGDSTIAVYGREGDNPFIKRVKIIGSGSVDAVSGTDGLDVTARNVGPGFEGGLLVVHDESNRGGRTSNLKYVPLSAVLEAS